MSFFAEAVSAAKDSFEPWRSLIVLDDAVMRRYAMAWSPALVRVRDHYPLEHDIATLWSCVEVDMRALGDLTGDSAQQVSARLRQAQGLQLIWPDGTVSADVVALLSKKLQKIQLD